MNNALAAGFLGVALILTGCAGSDIVADCPHVANWTPAQQSRMAADLRTLPQDSPVFGAMNDYARLQLQARACQKADNSF